MHLASLLLCLGMIYPVWSLSLYSRKKTWPHDDPTQHEVTVEIFPRGLPKDKRHGPSVVVKGIDYSGAVTWRQSLPAEQSALELIRNEANPFKWVGSDCAFTTVESPLPSPLEVQPGFACVNETNHEKLGTYIRFENRTINVENDEKCTQLRSSHYGKEWFSCTFSTYRPFTKQKA
ncbi:hypothetical protein F66182_6389 [Fusarium sp. NRRL 66182]|nr:hypothetical protein F66182_6389 [Fusarium sp. NRRL 66182]